MYENGQYTEAADKFSALGDYEDSQNMVKACNYEAAKVLFNDGSYEEAKQAFSELGDYEDSAQFVNECDYNIASALFDSGDYEGAIAIFETISDFSNSAAKIKDANQQLMLQQYGDVVNALDGNTWYFNGGSDTILNSISFADGGATIAQVSFDGNGSHDNGSNTYSYTLDDANITVTLNDGSNLTIAYTISDGAITLGENEYFSPEEVDAGLQGFWTESGSSVLGGSNEYNIQIDNGNISSESASEAIGYGNGAYYYYGPYTGTYTLNFGGFDTDMYHGKDYFFNIIDGEVKLLHFDTVCSRSDITQFPGEDGYSF